MSVPEPARTDHTQAPPIDRPMPYWTVTLRGVCMGAADVVPGVSGGTMALILGIYPRFIAALSNLGPSLLRDLWQSLTKGADRKVQILGVLARADTLFLIALGAGIGAAILSLARVIPHLLETYPAHMNGFFFGMIVASVVIPFKAMQRRGAPELVSFAAAAAFAYWLTGLTALNAPGGLPFLFVCGAIGVSAMLLPGVSGSFLLLVLGQYAVVLKAVRDFNLSVMLVFGMGMATGLLTFSRFLKWLLRAYPSQTMAALIGLMIGSLRKIWPFKVALEDPVIVAGKVIQDAQNIIPTDAAYQGPVVAPVLLAVLGLALVVLLERAGKNKLSH